MSAAFIGLDLAKSVFQVHGVGGQGKVVVAKRLRRDAVLGHCHIKDRRRNK